MEQQQLSRQYVGIDLHRRRSVIVRLDEAGKVLGTVRVDNDPVEFALAMAEAGEGPEVALEATYGYYWAADLLKANGANVHLVHPLGLHWDSRRVKNDVKDATELAKRLWREDLPEAWVAPPEVRELRELVRYRAKLVALRTSAKAQVHAVMAKQGILPALDDMFGPGGQVLLDEMPLDQPYRYRVDSLRRLIEVFDDEVGIAESQVHKRLRGHRGYRAIQALKGVGRGQRGHLRGRDRRHHPLSRCPPPVQLGRSHPVPPRVRRQGPPRAHNQAGFDAGALGGGRSRRPLPRRCSHRTGVHAHPGAPGHAYRPCGGGEETVGPGLLRAA